MPFHKLQVGEIECVVLADGKAKVGKDGILNRFPDVPQAELSSAFQAAGIALDDVETSYNPLLIHTGDEIVLVDGGETADRHETAGNTVASLAEAGVQPEEVTTVVISHAHGDHIAGLFNESLEFVYPKARYFITQAEWNYWADRQVLQNMGDYGKWMWERLKRLEPHIKKMNAGTQISPGIRAVNAPGHTVGHIGIMVESGTERLFHAVDLLHMPIQFAHPGWSIRFDTDKDEAAETRYRLLERAANDNLLTLFYHLSFPGLGYITKDGHAFAWKPI